MVTRDLRCRRVDCSSIRASSGLGTRPGLRSRLPGNLRAPTVRLNGERSGSLARAGNGPALPPTCQARRIDKQPGEGSMMKRGALLITLAMLRSACADGGSEQTVAREPASSITTAAESRDTLATLPGLPTRYSGPEILDRVCRSFGGALIVPHLGNRFLRRLPALWMRPTASCVRSPYGLGEWWPSRPPASALQPSDVPGSVIARHSDPLIG